jgi:hypothetical protein
MGGAWAGRAWVDHVTVRGMLANYSLASKMAPEECRRAVLEGTDALADALRASESATEGGPDGWRPLSTQIGPLLRMLPPGRRAFGPAAMIDVGFHPDGTGTRVDVSTRRGAWVRWLPRVLLAPLALTGLLLLIAVVVSGLGGAILGAGVLAVPASLTAVILLPGLRGLVDPDLTLLLRYLAWLVGAPDPVPDADVHPHQRRRRS